MSAFCTMRSACLSSIRVARKPGESFGTRKPFTWPSSASLAQMTVTSLMVPLPIQRLDPVMLHSSPRRVATVRRPRAESDPDSGSVRPKEPRISPDAKRGSHSARCSGDPATATLPITSPLCMPTRVAMLASTRPSSSAAQPR